MITVPESYDQSRSRFRSRLETLRLRWPDARLTGLSLPSAPHLTTDILIAGPTAAKDRLIVLSTGEHGIEGYLGSAVLELFLEEYARRLDPQKNGLLLIHAINPWGMEHWQRNNAANVDLNRNFLGGDFSGLKDFNPDYPALSPFLNPQKSLHNLTRSHLCFIASTVKNFAAFGPRRIREATLMGQYRFPGGIYFGGADFQPETASMMKTYREAFAGYREILHLDIHTGYGPRHEMTLVTSPQEKTPADQISARFGGHRVAATNPDEFYSIQGDMIDWEYGLMQNEFPNVNFFGATCEFGTFGDSLLQAARSLRITILNNQVNRYGADSRSAAWVEREYRELYLPSEPAWLEKAFSNARRTFEALVNT